jgi:hypothetical protein
MYTYCSPKKCIHIVLRKLSFINLKLCISSTFLKFKNKDYLLCRIVCGKNSPSHSRCKNKVSCDANSACLQSFHHRRPKIKLCMVHCIDVMVLASMVRIIRSILRTFVSGEAFLIVVYGFSHERELSQRLSGRCRKGIHLTSGDRFTDVTDCCRQTM